MTAQFEHTIILRPTCKEVVSRGDDYWYIVTYKEVSAGRLRKPVKSAKFEIRLCMTIKIGSLSFFFPYSLIQNYSREVKWDEKLYKMGGGGEGGVLDTGKTRKKTNLPTIYKKGD